LRVDKKNTDAEDRSEQREQVLEKADPALGVGKAMNAGVEEHAEEGASDPGNGNKNLVSQRRSALLTHEPAHAVAKKD
jgi:hypothetical protein